MIPQAYITEWSNQVPWQTNEQVEQDLVISRALVEIFSDEFLAESLAFRGGTALHKLYLHPQPRYSEDIDLVQIQPGNFGPVIDRLRERLSFLGKPQIKQKENNSTLTYRFESEFPPVQILRLKVETNCREHFTVLGHQQVAFTVKNTWFTGTCQITTYSLEELLGTKLRALYQRRKGRDLYDLYYAFQKTPHLNIDAIIQSYQKYMKFVVDTPPSSKQFILNMEAKILDSEFLGDITALIRSNDIYEAFEAYQHIKNQLIEKL
jgi:predicted nucleotidyltransferase component of viral defense system